MLNLSHRKYLAVLLICIIPLASPRIANAQVAAKAIHPIVGKWEYIGGSAGKVMSEKPVRMTFHHTPGSKNSYVWGQGGCNNVSRNLRIVGSDVVLEGPMRATRGYCGRLLHATETIVKRLLGHETGWAVKGSTLVLYDVSGQQFATFKKIAR